VEHGIGPHLRWLKYDDHKTIAPKLADNRQFVTAARFDADPSDFVLTQPG
jgi:hypothetical protein